MSYAKKDRRRNRQTGVQPTQETVRHIYGIGDDRLTLEELFVDGRPEGDTTLQDLKDVARFKLITVLRVPEMFGLGAGRRKVDDEYCVTEMDGTVDDLVNFIAHRMKGSHEFVKPHDLPEPYRSLNKHWRDTVRAQARYMLLQDVIGALVEKGVQLWYHEGHERWQASQSLMDEFVPLLRKVKGLPPHPKRNIKWDDHSYHGRPRRDRKRSATPGTSIGASH